MLKTAAELAPLLKVSVGQVYRLARANRIPAHHFGHAVRFNVDEVLAATVTTPAPSRTPRTVNVLALQRTALTTRNRTNLVVLTENRGGTR